MRVEHPLALTYLLPGNVYLLSNDRQSAIEIVIPTSEIPQVAEPEVPYQPPIKFDYTGGYQQKILILVHYPDHDTMEPAHQTALENTIKRKELRLFDVAILNMSRYPGTNLEMLSKFFEPAKMLLLGKNTLPAGLDKPILNQLIKTGDYTVLYTFSFAEMMGNKENTKAFWEQMKML